MNRTLTYNISQKTCGQAVHTFLNQEGFSAALLTKLRKNDTLCLINHTPSYLNTILQDGDILTIKLLEDKASEKIPPVKLDFQIIYEDEDILVVNKPYNMPIHPSLNNYENSLGNATAFYFRNEASPFVFRCVNRLDRDTTGLTIIAKNILASSILSSSIRDGQLHRIYYAIVEDLDSSLPDTGVINAPISRKEGSTIERFIDYVHGENAITHYNVLKRENGLALCKLILETGRTHQIRVHMLSIGHPLIGDFLYNPDNHQMSRQALHGGELSFVHPTKKEVMHLSAPLPDDFIIKL